MITVMLWFLKSSVFKCSPSHLNAKDGVFKISRLEDRFRKALVSSRRSVSQDATRKSARETPRFFDFFTRCFSGQSQLTERLEEDRKAPVFVTDAC